MTPWLGTIDTGLTLTRMVILGLSLWVFLDEKRAFVSHAYFSDPDLFRNVPSWQTHSKGRSDWRNRCTLSRAWRRSALYPTATEPISYNEFVALNGTSNTLTLKRISLKKVCFRLIPHPCYRDNTSQIIDVTRMLGERDEGQGVYCQLFVNYRSSPEFKCRSHLVIMLILLLGEFRCLYLLCLRFRVLFLYFFLLCICCRC